MTKFRFTTVALAAVLSLGFVTSSLADEIKGRVKVVAEGAKSMAVEVAGKGVVVVKFNGETKYKNASTFRDFITDEVVVVDFDKVGSENRAKLITKVIAPVPAGVKGLVTADMEALVKSAPGSYTLVDSRPPGRYNQGHLPTAVNIPLPELQKEGGLNLLPPDKAKTLVFYCGGLSCGLSPASATIAVKAGYTDVRLYPEGEPKWVKVDNATEASLAFVKSGNIVLVDLRSPEKAAAGYIPRAVNIPAAKLEASANQFPDFKGAPVVFYSDSKEEMSNALSLAREWGYGEAVLFPGGVKAWQAAGNQLATGPAPTKISYVRKLGEGELSINDFNLAAVDGKHVIVDARTPEEFAAGHFLNAVNIPAEEMEARYKELPAGKPPIVHCATGTRAELAWDVLKEKGVKAMYVKSNIDFSGTTAVMKE